ncbi:hypothetical protein EVA_16294 [gut metagenome]|uniref:Uncharacterized protein n=1 Tax=gut metagenome TaxID=749906 RepID=J9G1D6_9ZZZZ
MNTYSQHTALDTAIEAWLRGCVGFEVEDNAINTILIDREIVPGTNVLTLDKRTKELCKADLYMWCASTPSVKGSVEDANGTWKHKEGGTESSAFDKRNLRAMANDIYKRYGENKGRGSIRMKSIGMKVWRK